MGMTNDESKNNDMAVTLRETNEPSERNGESATKKSTSDQSDCTYDEHVRPNNARSDGDIEQIEFASVALDGNTTAQTATAEPQENGTLGTGEGVKIPAPDSDEKTAARRRLTAQRRLVRRAARKDARQRRQAKIRAERELAEQTKAEQTRIDLEVRLSRIKEAADGLQALNKRRERRKAVPEANEGEDRPKPVPVKLVKRIRRDADRPSTSDNGDETTVSSEDGLPTAKVLVNNIWHGIKLDSCARYTIAGTAWMKHGERIEGDAPIDYVEGIGGFLLDVVGVWRFKFKTVFGETVYADACIVDGCTDDFLLGVDFLRQHSATMDFQRNELSYGDDDRKVIIPFHTTEGATNEANGARVAAGTKRTQLQDRAVTSVEVAVAAPDGEVGIFVPSRRTGAVMLSATVTTVQNGKAWVPMVNSANGRVKLPSKKELGTWIPLDEDVEILAMDGALQRDRLKQWLNELGDGKPLDNENDVVTGVQDAESRELILKLLRAYPELVTNKDDCPPATALPVEHHIDTGDAAPIMMKRRRQAQTEDAIIEENVKKMLAAGVIEEGNGAWGFPVVLVRKKDGE
ncbi:hypothetical protein PHMEG_00034297, partial [Phytophthora megakarya]